MQQKKFEIDGVSYTVTAFGALEGQRVLGRAVALLGGGFASAKGDGVNEIGISAIGSILAKADDSRVEEIIRAFAVKTTYGDAKSLTELSGNNFENFDLHFERKYMAMTRWLTECFQFNYADFLGAAQRTFLSKLAALTSSPSTSPEDSTGSSGES
jgi:hypothetical protein